MRSVSDAAPNEHQISAYHGFTEYNVYLEEWMAYIQCSEAVITDSFHGTVFSIIFNKPFIVIANKERGLGRFTSLLRMLGLESRLVYTFDDITDQLIYTSIDYTQVNRILRRERDRALEFLKASLR